MKTCPQCRAPTPEQARVCAECSYDFQPAADPLIGKTLRGNFRITERIGAGAMGAIYKAEQTLLGRTVAVKVLHKHLLTDENLLKRFHREAQAAALLKHPNTIDIIEFGQAESGALYIAMEYIAGQDLADALHRDWPLANERVIRIMKQVCLALDQAHEKGIIHRDLKPENIMLERRKGEPDFVKVLDFGIAKIQDPERKGDRFQTIAGLVCGTPEYMAPEQARGEVLDSRCDLYALGVILYQLLTNTFPFTGDSPIAIVTRHLTDQLTPPAALRPDVHAGLADLAMRLMAKDRNDRPATAMAVHELLDTMPADAAAGARGEEPRASRAGARPALGVHDSQTRLFDLHQTLKRPARTAARRSYWPIVVGGAAIALVAAVVAAIVRSEPAPAASPTRATATSAATPTPAAARIEPRDAEPEEPRELGRNLVLSAPSTAPTEPAGVPVAVAPVPVVSAPTVPPEPPPAELPLPPVAKAPEASPKDPKPDGRPKEPKTVVKAPEQAAGDRAARADAAAAKAESAFKAGQYAAAAKAYDEAYRLRPNASLLKKMGYALAKAGDVARACTTFQRYIRALPLEKRTAAMAPLFPYKCTNLSAE